MKLVFIERSVVHGCPPGWTRFQTRCFIFQNVQKAAADAEPNTRTLQTPTLCLFLSVTSLWEVKGFLNLNLNIHHIFNSVFRKQSICLSLGGNLASIHNRTENTFLSELVRTACGSYSSTWVGGHDGVKEGQWMWTDGSKFDYQTWGQGEPNNLGEEDCLHIYFTAEYWNDRRCDLTLPFICAKDLGTVKIIHVVQVENCGNN
ncbi:galactose-specific lectin nattectin-like [Parambassis ranga]|uniref:Galactose-specific lectin nattectin-like n=1 Tax=Parambassis ranga TaxID=210632 RepID=A0A6P7HFV9_9TELE|nr:galactose-specific lectin nattectin-like [Parambassis ranga]